MLLDGGFRQVYRLHDIAIRQVRRHQPQNLPFVTVNILIFVETFRVHEELSALLAKQADQSLSGHGTPGLHFLPAFPHRRQPQRVVLEQPAIVEIPGLLERGEEQADGLLAITFLPIRHRK